MPAESAPPLLQRIGGPWLLSTPLIAFASAGLVLSVFAGEPSATASGAEAARWLVVAAGAVVLYVAYALILRRVCRGRYARDGFLPPSAAVAIVLGAVVLDSVAIHVGALALDLEVRQALPLRIALMAPFAVWFGCGFVVLLDEIGRSRGARRRLLERRTDVALADLQQDLMIAGLRDVQWREVERQLAAPRRSMLEQLDRGDAAAAGGLRELAEGSVREVSARLWAQAEREYPRLGIAGIVRGIVRSEPFHPWVMAAVIVVGSGQSAVALFGWRAGSLLTIASAAVAAAAMLLGNAAMRRQPDRHAAIFLGVLGVLLLGLWPTYVVREGLVPGSAPPSWLLVQAVSLVTAIVLISAVGAWVHGGQALRRSYLLAVDERHVRSLARARAVTVATRDVAQALHGTVQTKLIAAAVAGEQAVESGDRAALQRAFDEARQVLEDLGSAERPVGAIADEVALKAALWEGLCEIRLAVGDLAGARADAEGVGRVVEEGIANAIRHGGATVVDIAVRAAPDGSVEVVVDDDGSGLAAGGPGIGSAILDAVTGGGWERMATERGCRLTARVPALAALPT
jgi:signal transduction histidine kinase